MQYLRSVPDKLLGVIAMFAAIFVLVILPWLDTSKVRSTVFRPIYKQFYWFLVADVLILGYVGAMPAEGIYLLIARVATAYYFAHFLIILPFLGMKEKTTPLPLSITEPVLGGSADMAMARNNSDYKEKTVKNFLKLITFFIIISSFNIFKRKCCWRETRTIKS